MLEITQCPIRTAMTVLGKKWVIELIAKIYVEKQTYQDLKNKLNGISDKVLFQRLLELQENKIIHKSDGLYKLTKEGYRLRYLLFELALFSIIYQSKEHNIISKLQLEKLIHYYELHKEFENLVFKRLKNWKLSDKNEKVKQNEAGVLFTVDLLSAKWIIEIITDISANFNTFTAIQEMNPGLSATELTRKLQHLEKTSLIKSKVKQYKLTEIGNYLRNILFELAVFCGFNYPEKIINHPAPTASDIIKTMSQLFGIQTQIYRGEVINLIHVVKNR